MPALKPVSSVSRPASGPCESAPLTTPVVYRLWVQVLTVCSANFDHLDWYHNKLGIREYLEEKNRSGEVLDPAFSHSTQYS
jgi:hypothetical protein